MARFTIGVAVALCVASAVSAQPVINVGNLYAPAGELQAWNRIMVSGGDEVQGLEFNIQIDSSSTPLLDSIDILNGTIFDGNNDGLFPGSYVDDYWAYQGVVTNSGTVTADGLLATVVFAAPSTSVGMTFAVSLTNTPEGPTNFAGISADITDGQLVITVPGDTNGDFKVDIQDLTTLSTHWSALPQNQGVHKWWDQGNFNVGEGGSKDWVVDIQDLTALSANWSFTGSAPPVPEPATLALLTVGGLLIARRRR